MSTIEKKRLNFAIGLVLYHPGDSLQKRIDKMVDLGFTVFIFDNSPFDEKNTFGEKERENIVYLTAGKNVGVGYSLSTLCATAYAHGYLQLLFFDQDTVISEKTLEFINGFSQLHQLEIRGQYAALVFTDRPGANNSIQEVRLAINSGSLFDLKILKQIGWHNEKYFVDCVDYELCLRARRLGYKIGVIKNTPDLDHITEQPDVKLNIFGNKILVRSYSNQRIYDSLKAHGKLVVCGLFKNHPGDTYALCRSLGLYIFGQIISRFTKGKKWK